MGGLPSELDRLLDAFEHVLEGRDRAAFAEICALDVHYEDPFTTAPLHGVEALAEHVSRLWGAAPDVRVETSGDRLSDGRYICAPVRVHGTHTGEVSDALPATGRRFDTQVLLYCELDAERERIWRVRAFFDAYKVAVQTGVLPEPGGTAEKALLALRGFGVRARQRATRR